MLIRCIQQILCICWYYIIVHWYDMTFEVVTEETSCKMIPCGLVNISSTLKMGSAGSYKTSVDF